MPHPLRSLINLAAHRQALCEALFFLYKNRTLIRVMSHRDIAGRYTGQLFGLFWAIGHPFFQMAILVFIFGVVFRQKVGGTFDMPLDYTVYILSGLAPWLSLAPVLTASSTAIVGNANLIKQFAFDARLLPAKEIVVGSVVWAVSIAIVTAYTLAAHRMLPWTYFLLPIVSVIHFMTALGCAWILSSLSVFLRDIKDAITVLNMAMLYLLPVVYLPAWVPELFRPIIYVNPFSYLIWCYQDVMYFGRFEHPWAWVISPLFATFLFISGYRLFRRLQPMFGAAL